jgi:hypothetical protein
MLRTEFELENSNQFDVEQSANKLWTLTGVTKITIVCCTVQYSQAKHMRPSSFRIQFRSQISVVVLGAQSF